MMSPTQSSHQFRCANLAASFVLLTAGLLWTWSAGMDLNWDLLNYHYYGAYALLNERMAQDYLPSYQVYFNPTVFVPFYWLVQAGVPSLVIALLLALVHLINVYVCRALTASMIADPQRSPWLPWAGALLMFVTPLFLTVIGNSFADAITSLPILCALLLLSRSSPHWGVTRDAAIAGLLLGIAGGLKLTNVFLALCASITAVTMTRASVVDRIRIAASLGIGGIAGALITHGYWSYELYRTFASPVFPLFNNVFHSPDFTTAPYVDQRYVMGMPFWEQLLLPVRMLEAGEWIYSENAAPDLRPLSLLLVMAAAAAFRFRMKPRASGSISFPLRWMSTFFAISFPAWILISSNGRYAIALLFLIGPLLAAWLAVLLKDRWAMTGAVLLAGSQIALQAHAGNPRWDPAQWQTPWIDVEVPADLKSKPYTFLLTLNQSYAAIAPSLHPASSLIGLIGQYIQPLGEKMPPELRRRLDQPASSYRVVLRGDLREDGSFIAEPATYRYRASPLIPYGFKLASSDCEMIAIRRSPLRDVMWPGRVGTMPLAADPGFRPLAVCKVDRAPAAEMAAVRAMVEQASTIFDRVEQACGRQLDPQGSQTAYYYMKPYRNYLNTNRQIIYDAQTNLLQIVQLGVEGRIGLGPAPAWLSDNPPRCPSFPPSHDSGLMP